MGCPTLLMSDVKTFIYDFSTLAGMERNVLVVLLFGCATWHLAIGQVNLLVNPSFEEDLAQTWKAASFTMERNNSYSTDGDYSIKCSGRYVITSVHALPTKYIQ